MQITKEQWVEIEANLSRAWGSVELKIDGYTVNLEVQQEKSLKYVIMTYVDGEWKGAWMSSEAETDQAKRFFRKISRYALKPKVRAELIKLYGGKRCPKVELVRINRQVSYFSPIWSSVKDMRRNLVKNNQSLELVRIGHKTC